MKLEFIETKANCPIAVIDNFFAIDEVEEIKKELNFIYSCLLQDKEAYSQQAAGSAKDDNNIALRNSNSVFVDNIFANDRSVSKILTLSRKIFSDKFLLDSLTDKSFFYKHIENSNRDWILANFYSDKNYYKPHTDYSCFTVITFFELEKFDGGELTFPEFNVSIEPIESRCVIFPGFLKHSAEPVSNGIRASLAHFINYI